VRIRYQYEQPVDEHEPVSGPCVEGIKPWSWRRAVTIAVGETSMYWPRLHATSVVLGSGDGREI
jgi:hypothetical protein